MFHYAMRWKYYLQVLLSGTLLNLYRPSGLFYKTGSVLQAKTFNLYSINTRSDSMSEQACNRLLGDKSAGCDVMNQRPLASSQLSNITHQISDSSIHAGIKNYLYRTRMELREQSFYNSFLHFERSTGEYLSSTAQTTFSFLWKVMAGAMT